MRYSIAQRITGEDAVNMMRYSVELWSGNRTINIDKVSELVNQLNREDDPEFLGPIPIYVAIHRGKKYLLDGQHRTTALSQCDHPGKFVLFLVEIQCEGTLEKEFERINCGTPVPPEYWDRKVRNVIELFLGRLRMWKKDISSESARPQRPRYNEKKVLQDLCDNTRLRDAIRFQNLDHVALYDAAQKVERASKSFHTVCSPAPQRCLELAEKLDFYMGLDAAWPYQVAARAMDYPVERTPE